MNNILKFTKVRDVKSPTRGTNGSAGIDFYIPEGMNYEIEPNCSVLIPSGIKVLMPNDHALIAFNKSGIASKKELDVMACVIDQDYAGEIHINLSNVGRETQYLKAGDKVVQFILLPINICELQEIETVDELYKNTKSERGEGGFGSTGNR